METNKFSFKSRILSFKFAFKGLGSLLKNEHNARIHLVAAIVSIIAGIFLNINAFEWSLLVIVIGIVFITEILNTSVETLADFVQPEWNERIRKVKDYSAAAVMISAIISVIVGGLIFIPKIFALFLTGGFKNLTVSNERNKKHTIYTTKVSEREFIVTFAILK